MKINFRSLPGQDGITHSGARWPGFLCIVDQASLIPTHDSNTTTAWTPARETIHYHRALKHPWSTCRLAKTKQPTITKKGYGAIVNLIKRAFQRIDISPITHSMIPMTYQIQKTAEPKFLVEMKKATLLLTAQPLFSRTTSPME